MKKLVKLTSLVCVLSLALVSCHKITTEGVSRPTFYPDFEMAGDALILHELGTPFVDPGVKAFENGEEIPVETSVTGAYRGGTTVDGMMADQFIITYTAINKDGYAGTTQRVVWVAANADLTTSLEGLYSVDIHRTGGSGDRFQTGNEYVIIWRNDDGTYQFSDGIGGYYNIGVGYGLQYISSGAIVTVNDFPSNDFSVTPFSNDGFGGTHMMTSLAADAAANQVLWVTDWTFGFIFNCTGNVVAL